MVNKEQLHEIAARAQTKAGAERWKWIYANLLESARQGQNSYTFYVTYAEYDYVLSQLNEMKLNGQIQENTGGYDIIVYW